MSTWNPTISEYHTLAFEDPPVVSSTMLGHLMPPDGHPLKYAAYYVDQSRTLPEITDAMKRGGVVDWMLFDIQGVPNSFDDLASTHFMKMPYFPIPPGVNKTQFRDPKGKLYAKSGPGKWNDFLSSAPPDAEHVPHAIWSEAEQCARAVLYPQTGAAEAAKDILLGPSTDTQVSVRYKIAGIPMRSRIDALTSSERVSKWFGGEQAIVELKVSDYAGPDGANKLIQRCRRQLAAQEVACCGQEDIWDENWRCIDPNGPSWGVLAITPHWPHQVFVWEVSERHRVLGRQELLYALRLLRQCHNIGEWCLQEEYGVRMSPEPKPWDHGPYEE